MCLHKVLQGKAFDVRYLLTTVNRNFRRISMHGVREELLEAQARSIGIPLIKVYVSEGSNEEYERNMEETLRNFINEGITNVIFGDIFLEDLRKYREDNLAKVNMRGFFPLWKRETKELIEEFLALGFQTVTCCTNDAYLGEEWVGRMINREFVTSLPPGVDPCGENGEFHTFCFSGPLLKKEIKFTLGEKVFQPLEVKQADAATTKGFWYCDLLPA